MENLNVGSFSESKKNITDNRFLIENHSTKLSGICLSIE